jgi:hypothetical protein
MKKELIYKVNKRKRVFVFEDLAEETEAGEAKK